MNLLERIEQLVIRYPEKDTQIAQYDYKTRTTSMVPSKDYTELYFEIKRLIHDFVDFDFNTIGNDGVYLIEDFYIGKTTNMVSRIIQHIVECFGVSGKYYSSTANPNVEKNNLIKSVLSERKLKVKMIDLDKEKESEHITNHFLEGFNLTNRTHKPKPGPVKVKNKKVKPTKKYVKKEISAKKNAQDKREKEMIMITEVIKRLNAKGIFVGLSGDGIFCAENHKPIVDATMREVGLEFAMKDCLT